MAILYYPCVYQGHVAPQMRRQSTTGLPMTPPAWWMACPKLALRPPLGRATFAGGKRCQRQSHMHTYRNGSSGECPRAGKAPGTDTSVPVSDTWLGALFVKLLPGYLFYAPSFIMPITAAAAALGAIYGPGALAMLAHVPGIRSVGPLATMLRVVGTDQPWSGIASVALSLLSAWYAFILMPVLDWLLGSELRNPTAADIRAAADEDGGLYRRVLYAYVPVHYIILATVCHLICTHAVSPVAFAGVAISCGVANGILFTVAHELLHGHRRLDQILASVLLAVVSYGHWSKSHLLHHVKVATPEDPSSARRGESLWAFLPRSIYGNIVDGYGAERTRCQTLNIPWWSLNRNRALLWIGGPCVLAGLATMAYGICGLIFYMMQAFVGVLMLEVVNYVEHYGLIREKLPKRERYERVGPAHSWNATTVYTNAAAFHLQRHSDHHACESTPYHLLRNLPQAPQLPLGYPAMMVLATVPPLFFKIMDPLLDRRNISTTAEAVNES